MKTDDRTRIGRRTLLAAGASGAAVAAVHALAGPARVLGADGDVAKVGQNNIGTNATAFGSTGGDGAVGSSQTAIKSGVYGVNTNGGGYGVFGRNTANHNYGHLGGPTDAVAGRCELSGRSGVYGVNTNSDGWGVFGRNEPGGLLGWLAGAGVAVHGEAPWPTLALRVIGRVGFTRSGVVTVSAGKRSVKKTGIPLAASSLVLATIQQDRVGVYVEAAVPSVAGSYFTIYLNKNVASATRVAWFVLG